ncbi:MAG TPA: hypothetical protein VIR16_04595 [Candidatus Limnocylindrales bacterium]
MTSQTNGNGGPHEDPWAESVATTGDTMRARAATMLQALPSELDGATDAMAGAMRQVSTSVASAPDDSLLVGASLASGMAIGLLLGRGSRLLAAGAVVAAVSLGASLVQRHPGRRRAYFGRAVMA